MDVIQVCADRRWTWWMHVGLPHCPLHCCESGLQAAVNFSSEIAGSCLYVIAIHTDFLCALEYDVNTCDYTFWFFVLLFFTLNECDKCSWSFKLVFSLPSPNCSADLKDNLKCTHFKMYRLNDTWFCVLRVWVVILERNIFSWLPCSRGL